jgi:hypothetical protein
MPLDREHQRSAVRVMRHRPFVAQSRLVGFPDAILVVIPGGVVGMSPRPPSGHVLVAL